MTEVTTNGREAKSLADVVDDQLVQQLAGVGQGDQRADLGVHLGPHGPQHGHQGRVQTPPRGRRRSTTPTARRSGAWERVHHHEVGALRGRDVCPKTHI